MKRVLAVALIFSAFGASAQQKLIGFNSTSFNETGAVISIDSSEYVYNSWGGSIYSNEPQFIFDESIIVWEYNLPSIKWDMQNEYSGFSQPLSLTKSWNNTIANWNVTVSESATSKEEFTYDAAGNLTNNKSYYHNGLMFILNTEKVYEFDANNNKTVEQYISLSTGLPVVEKMDSLFYDASNNLTRYISYVWDGTSAYFASSQSLFTYSGSEVTDIELYGGSQSTPLEWEFDIDYTYTAGQPTNILGYQVTGGVPDMNAMISINFTYGANQKLSLYQGYLSGDLFDERSYVYDGQNFLTEINKSEMNFSTSAVYLSNASKFYYQNTAGIDEVEVAEATVFPNPSSDFITISADSEIEEVAVFNANGSIMISQKGGGLDISNLPIGVYIAKVKTATGVAQARFVKQ
jgi:hypothetical protein